MSRKTTNSTKLCTQFIEFLEIFEFLDFLRFRKRNSSRQQWSTLYCRGMSLYRKYRPQAFADVAGQQHIVTTLEQAVEQEKLSHAYLFSGMRGTGKTSIARILAKVILTRGMEDEALKQHVLTAVEEGNLVDLVEIDAASNRGIDDIRSLLEKIQFSPVVAKAKVYIIDEVHMLTREAFNALLKTLEEPPPYAYFILATTELHKIPATIQSRCQRFLFRALQEEDIVRRLRYIADQENITVDQNALEAMAHYVQGGLRDAISLLDQLRSLPHITRDEVRSRIGESGHEQVGQVLQAIEDSDRDTVIQLVRQLEEAGSPLEHFLRLLLAAVRTAMHRSLEAKQPVDKHLHILDILLTAIRDVRSAPVPGLVLEAALLHLCDEQQAGSPHSAPAVPPATVQSAPAPKPAPAPQSKAPSPPQKVETVQQAAAPGTMPTLEDIRAKWDDVLRAVEPAATRMSLKNAKLQGIEQENLILAFSSSFHREKVNNTEAARNVEEALRTTFGYAMKLKCILDIAEAQPAPIASGDLVNLADAAAEIF